MFSIFKSKKNPLTYKNNMGFVETLAKHIAESSITSAEGERDFVEQLEKDKLDSKPENRSTSDTAFECWTFNLYLITISLNVNKIKHKDASDEIFALPVFEEIYKLSKPQFLVLHKTINDAVQTNYGEYFDEAVAEKLDALRALPLAEADQRIDSQSAICLTLRNILKYLAYDLRRDIVLEQKMILNTFRDADRRMNLYDGVFITMRKNMR
jgi:hypothetical protein